MEESKKMAKIACAALADKKGEDIKVIDISNVSVLADYFIIANGTNDSQVHAMVDSVEEELEKAGFALKQREGYGSWKLGIIGLWRSDCTCSLIKKIVFSMIWKESGVMER